MTGGDVFIAVVSFLSGVGIIGAFVKVWFVDPQVKQTNVHAETNSVIARLADKLDHQNELTEVRLIALQKEVEGVDIKIDRSFAYLNGKVVKIEEVVFEKQ